MASGSQNMTTYNARTVTGSNSAASPAGALLLSGEGRADDATGDTWIFLDSHGGTSAPWGIKHDQANNKIHIYGSNTDSVWSRMNTGDTYILGKVGIGYNPETSGNSYKLYVNGSSYFSNTIHLPNGLLTGSRVSGTGSGVEIDDDGGIEIYHTSTPFIDFHYQASTADYSVRLICNSATSLKCIGAFTANGNITADGGYLYAIVNGNTVQIGSQNGSYAHFTNTKDIPFWFNKIVQSDGGFTIYNTGDNHWRNGYIKINNNSGGDCYIELRRASNADWRFLSSGGNLYFQNNWTSSKVAYFNVLQLDYNTGRAHFKEYVYASYFNASCGAETPADGSYWIFANSDGFFRKSTRANLAAKIDIEHKWVRIGGDTMTGALTVTSTGNNRATVYIRSAAAVPIDLYLGSNKTNYWSISCRESTDPWLGFYYAGSGAGWALTMRTNKHVEIPVHAYVGGYNNTSYALSTASFICNSWIRTTGSTGWYSESHGGGWYMSDNTWIRSYNNKAVYTASGIIRSDSAVWGNSVVINSNWIGFYNGVQGGTRYGYIQCNASRMYFRKENGVSTYHFDMDGGYLYTSRCYNAVWNDYAECRAVATEEPGRCVTESSSGEMQITTKRLQSGCKIISDTYGTCIGATDTIKTPIAVSGRVLVYPYQDRNNYSLGAAVCSGPNGTVDLMTRDEIMMYPERIVGTVSEIPTYEIWYCGSKELPEEVHVNGRIWIYVR